MRKPRQRTGTALPNQDAHDAAASRLASGARYQTNPDRAVTTPKLKPQVRTEKLDIPTVHPDDISKPKEKTKPAATKTVTKPERTVEIQEETKPTAKPKPTKPDEIVQVAYGVQILPAQKAQVDDIAKRLGVTTDYVEAVLRKNIQSALLKRRDADAWSDLREGTVRRLGVKQERNTQFFRSATQMSETDLKLLSKTVNDPLNMIPRYKILSAIANEILGAELDKLDADTSAS